MDKHEDRKVRKSQFFITINTNKKFRDREVLAVAAKHLALTAQKVFGTKEYMEQVIHVLPKGDSFFEHIGKIHTNSVIENSGSGLHLHAQVICCHVTKLRLHFPVIRQLFLGFLQVGIPDLINLYMNVKVVRNQTEAITNYLFKNIRGMNLRMCDGQEFPDEVEVSHEIRVAPLTLFF